MTVGWQKISAAGPIDTQPCEETSIAIHEFFGDFAKNISLRLSQDAWVGAKTDSQRLGTGPSNRPALPRTCAPSGCLAQFGFLSLGPSESKVCKNFIDYHLVSQDNILISRTSIKNFCRQKFDTHKHQSHKYPEDIGKRIRTQRMDLLSPDFLYISIFFTGFFISRLARVLIHPLFNWPRPSQDVSAVSPQ